MNRLEKMYEWGAEGTEKYVQQYFDGFLNIRCTVNRKNRRDCVTIVVMEDLITEEEIEDFLIFFDCPFDIETGPAPEIRGNYIQLNFYIHDWETQEYCCDSDFDV